MNDRFAESPSVVVGIDGSRTAIDAALWAVDEAVDRDIPLRLVYAIDPDSSPGADDAQKLAAAEIAVRHAFTAVESTDKPVKIEVEILQGRPSKVLHSAARWAAILCVGSVGLKHVSRGQVGSTAAALAISGHCPVAIIRGFDPTRNKTRWVVAEVDDTSATDGVLLQGIEEARIRRAPLRVVTTWHSRFTDIYDGDAVGAGSRMAKAQLDRRLAQWRHRHPDVAMKATAVHGNIHNFLARNADSIQLLVVSPARAHGVRELVGPPGYAALHKAGSSVLVCGPPNVL